jgi:hypothetical protein
MNIHESMVTGQMSEWLGELRECETGPSRTKAGPSTSIWVRHQMKRDQSLRFFRYGCLLWLVGVVLATTSTFGQAKPDPWIILVSGENGAIHAHTTRQDLVRTYEATNVVDKDVDIGEGETQPGTVLFPKDPQRSIEILWKDPDKQTLPASAQIEGSASRWKAAHNISLGTSLKELERLNGRPFHLSGFGWDYSGTITSWDNGSLAAELEGGHGRVLVRLGTASDTQVPDADQSQVMGDRDFPSDHPVMQKLNPRAYQLIWVFTSTAEK